MSTPVERVLISCQDTKPYHLIDCEAPFLRVAPHFDTATLKAVKTLKTQETLAFYKNFPPKTHSLTHTMSDDDDFMQDSDQEQ